MRLILENVMTVLSESISSHVYFFVFKSYYNNDKSFESVGVGILKISIIGPGCFWLKSTQILLNG